VRYDTQPLHAGECVPSTLFSLIRVFQKLQHRLPSARGIANPPRIFARVGVAHARQSTHPARKSEPRRNRPANQRLTEQQKPDRLPIRLDAHRNNFNSLCRGDRPFGHNRPHESPNGASGASHPANCPKNPSTSSDDIRPPATWRKPEKQVEPPRRVRCTGAPDHGESGPVPGGLGRTPPGSVSRWTSS